MEEKIDYPKQTSEWGRSLIDILNAQLGMIQIQLNGVKTDIRDVNGNIDAKFENFEKTVNDAREVAQSALTLAEKNSSDIADISSELKDTRESLAELRSELRVNKEELAYCKFNCDELKTENHSLKMHANKLDNYSRRKNIIIRGVEEEKNESNAQCELKVKSFMKSQLKLSDDVVDNMQFEGCHRLAVFANRRRRVVHHQQNRSIIVRFRNNADKSLVWGAKSHITDHHVSISDNYCSDTEYKRNRLYMIYKKAKSLDKFKQKTSLSGEVLVIDGSHYTVEDLHNLPDELNIRQFSEKVNNDFYVFGGIHSSANPFSNWYSCKIQHEGHTFKSVEQAYQFSKATYMNDVISAAKLRYTVNPGAAKRIGSKVAGINDSNWDTDKYTVMKELIVKKFTGNEELKTELVKTGTKTLVECGRDVNYACGLPITHKDIFSKTKWTGKNKLGDILCEVRSNIK